MPRRPWIGTSWKMTKTIAEADIFCAALSASDWSRRGDAVQLFVIPPFTVLNRVACALAGTDVLVGAQNAHWMDSGAWTGEISPVQVKDCGGRLVEIGHSERRMYFGESDVTVALRTAAAVRHGLTALVCIGDTRAEYEAQQTAEVLRRQIEAALSKLDTGGSTGVILAYEPVWSIGEGGTPADPAFADEQHARIKELTSTLTGTALPVLYGGSVNAQNCVDFSGRANIDGLFIGRSAWNVQDYLGIVSEVTASLAAPTNA